MKSVGAYDAKTNLAQLLDEVEKGERVVITRHGRPVAILEPFSGREVATSSAAVSGLKEFRKGRRLGKLTVKELIEEGRK